MEDKTSKPMISMALIEEQAKNTYKKYYKVTFKDGALNKREKELISIGVASALSCKGCLKGHLRKAVKMGITLDEIREAVATAVGVAAATVIDHTDIVNAEMGLVVDEEHETA